MHSIFSARTSLSVGEFVLSVDDLIKAATETGAKSVAVTDNMSVTALIDFSKKAKKAEIKPIIGCNLRLVDNPGWRKTKEDKKTPPEYFVTWYVLSATGMEALFKLLTLANSEDRFYNVPKLSFDDLYKALADVTTDDVAISSSDALSVILHNDAAVILSKIKSALCASNTFVTLVPVNTPYWDRVNARAIEVAKEVGLEALVARPALYPQNKPDAHEIMGAVVKNTPLSSMFHRAMSVRNMHPISVRDLVEECKGAARRLTQRYKIAGAGTLFAKGLTNTEALASRVTYEWKKADVSLPKMAPDEFRAVVDACKAGWGKRFVVETFGHKPTSEELREIYRPRLEYELSVLKKLNFSGYFLLVQDVVQFAKGSGILVGPGRGSAGGSLVAYLMGITDCDPIRFGLLFERFINPDRIDLPDADLDFMSERRHEVIEYLVKKYGADRVAGVSNILTLGPKSAIRDVSKAFGLDEFEYRCSKLAPDEHGQSVELKKAAEQIAEIGAFRDKYRDLWNICLDLEGTTKTFGRHAAGIVVGGEPLTKRAAIERRSGDSVVCWDKRIVEEQGLVKMDILGLNTLDLIDKTVAYIKKRHPERIDLMKVPLDDPKVLANFAAGLTVGVFQFESGGVRRLLKELGADGRITFEDITAATALYRPGPMESGMMDSYYLRKQGIEAIEYDHPLLADVLKETYGVYVYQEEVMQASRVIAGYSAPDADKLRRIMGKKLHEEMEKERGKFVKGCMDTIGASEKWSNDQFEKIAGFAGYGFNKSHSCEYALISWQCMFLKTYYPVEFFASALSLMKDEKLLALLKDAERLGIEIVLPDINLSTDQFEILTDTKLCIPFNRVKGLSTNAAIAIVEARAKAGGKFAAFEDFHAAVDKRLVNKGKVEVLHKIGAFASIDASALPAKHQDRIRDQRELLPGLITDIVPVHRVMNLDRPTKLKIAEIVYEYRRDYGPQEDDTGDGMPVGPMIGRKAKFMVIADAPTNGEESEGRMSRGRGFDTIAEALSEAGLAREDGYWTALIKRPKSGKQVTPKEIADYQPYLHREIAALKPPLIVLNGSTVVRQFLPDFKGKVSDSAGKVIYSKELDANLVIGFNPGEIFHAPEKQTNLNDVFSAVSQILDS